jgi:hypothetical protein
MVLNHIAAVLLFSGPVFYIGLWMAVDPGGVAAAPRWLAAAFRRMEPRSKPMPPGLRVALRLAGVILVLLAIAL